MLPIISAVSESFATITDKFILKNNNLNSKKFVSILFIFMGFFCIPLLYFIDINRFDNTIILVLMLIILGSALQNYLFYVTLKKKDLSILEPIRNSEPIIIILMAFLIFPTERSPLILVLGVITTLALIYSQYDKDKIKNKELLFDKYMVILLASVFTSAVLYIGYKYVLDFISPISLYVIRTLGVVIFLSIIFKPNIFELNKKQSSYFFLSGFLYSLAAITQYFAIKNIGISLTVLILTLSPIIIYLGSNLLLKEKIKRNQIISSVIIITCVIVAKLVYL